MKKIPKFTPNPSLKLMDQVRQVLRYHHYAINTERTYCQWILRFIHFYGARRHPREMGPGEIESFLSPFCINMCSILILATAFHRSGPNVVDGFPW